MDLDSITIQLDIDLKPASPLTPCGEGVGGWGVVVQALNFKRCAVVEAPHPNPSPHKESGGKGSSNSVIKRTALEDISTVLVEMNAGLDYRKKLIS